jgi:deazaflavin-dependent oxidoreductase (nitroreductase family)
MFDAFNRRFTRIHSAVYIGSRGWVGHRWTGIPSLILTTTGRRSGARRSVVLVYATDGHTFLIVASNFGQAKAPAWLLNLSDHPAATIHIGHRVREVKADIVAPDDPRYPRIFALANDNNRRRFDRYRAMVSRPIPVVVLSPSA